MNSSKAEQLTETILAVFQANGQLLDWGDRFVAPFGLTSARWQMLGALALAGGKLTAPQLASSMGVSRQGAQKQLNLLLAEQLVSKHHNPYHRRSPFYSLTDTGQQTYTKVECEWNKHAKRLSRELDLNDILITRRVLKMLIARHRINNEGDD